MSSFYTTTLGKTVVMGKLSPEQKKLLRRALTLFQNKEEWGKFCNEVVYSNKTVKILGGALFGGTYWLTEYVRNTPLFQVLVDMEVRLGIEQGKMIQDDRTYWDFTENEKALETFLKSPKLTAEAIFLF